MEKLVKPSIYLGGLSGIVFGFLLLIPLIAPFMFFLSFILAGMIVIIIPKKTNSVGIISIQTGCMMGAVGGFSSLIAASVVYIPCIWLIHAVFNFNPGGFDISRIFSLSGYNILAVSMLILFTAILSAVINAFFGMITAFVFEKTENTGLNFQEHLDSEQVDEIIQ